MKILKPILYVIGGLVALILIIPLFVKKEYAVEREIIINRRKSEVFDYVKYMKNQDNFSVWAKADPKMKKDFKGEDGNVGAVAFWESKEKNVGKGEQEIIGIKENERIDFELRFKEPFEANDKAYMVTEDAEEGKTKVKWGFNGKMNYPMNIMLVFMDMDEMLGKDLSTGLSNLKNILEK